MCDYYKIAPGLLIGFTNSFHSIAQTRLFYNKIT